MRRSPEPNPSGFAPRMSASDGSYLVFIVSSHLLTTRVYARIHKYGFVQATHRPRMIGIVQIVHVRHRHIKRITQVSTAFFPDQVTRCTKLSSFSKPPNIGLSNQSILFGLISMMPVSASRSFIAFLTTSCRDSFIIVHSASVIYSCNSPYSLFHMVPHVIHSSWISICQGKSLQTSRMCFTALEKILYRWWRRYSSLLD